MAIIFRYARERLLGRTMYRAPFIPILAHDAAGRLVRITALVDSGADTTVIPRDLAERLDMPLGEEIETSGIGGATKARKTAFPITVQKGRESYNLRVPALALLDPMMDIPLILGRNGFFDEFDMTFRQAEEKLVLKKAAAA